MTDDNDNQENINDQEDKIKEAALENSQLQVANTELEMFIKGAGSELANNCFKTDEQKNFFFEKYQEAVKDNFPSLGDSLVPIDNINQSNNFTNQINYRKKK